MASNRYVIEYAKTARSSCKNAKCKGKIAEGELRIGKVVHGKFQGEERDMHQWYHAACAFDAQARARSGTKKIDSPAVFEAGWDAVKDDDKKKVEDFIAGKNMPHLKEKPKAAAAKPKKKKKADSEDDDGGDDSGSDAEKPKKKAKAAPKKKKAESDDDGSADDEIVPKSSKRGPPKNRD